MARSISLQLFVFLVMIFTQKSEAFEIEAICRNPVARSSVTLLCNEKAFVSEALALERMHLTVVSQADSVDALRKLKSLRSKFEGAVFLRCSPLELGFPKTSRNYVDCNLAAVRSFSTAISDLLGSQNTNLDLPLQALTESARKNQEMLLVKMAVHLRDCQIGAVATLDDQVSNAGDIATGVAAACTEIAASYAQASVDAVTLLYPLHWYERLPISFSSDEFYQQLNGRDALVPFVLKHRAEERAKERATEQMHKDELKKREAEEDLRRRKAAGRNTTKET